MGKQAKTAPKGTKYRARDRFFDKRASFRVAFNGAAHRITKGQVFSQAEAELWGECRDFYMEPVKPRQAKPSKIADSPESDAVVRTTVPENPFG